MESGENRVADMRPGQMFGQLFWSSCDQIQ